MRALIYESEVQALRGYLLSHTVSKLARESGICTPTLKRIIETNGNYELRKADIRTKLLKVLSPYIEQSESNSFSNTTIDSKEAVKRQVIIDMILDKLDFLDNAQLVELFAQIIQQVSR